MTPELSIILPVHNGARTLPQVLAALRAAATAACEIIAVDDGSTDGSGEILREGGVDVLLTHDRPLGPWVSRNRAADAARGGVLFFVDADVAVMPDAVDRIREFFARRGGGGGTALIGLYSRVHPHRGVVSRFKNAWIRYSYLRSERSVDWFFTAAGALPAELFRRLGGFREDFSVRTGGGDIEFGRRLRDHGADIVLDPAFDVVHLKHFDLPRLLRNDFRRAYGWSRLALQSGGRERDAGDGAEPGTLGQLARLSHQGFANVSGAFVAGVSLSWLAVGGALLGLAGQVPAAVLLPLAAWCALNARFWTWLVRNETPGVAAAAVPLTFLDHLSCGVGVARAILESTASRAIGRERSEP